ncbi:MAG TPA: hypothetical protein VKF62_00980, partial [Planctomycetota bacterium]|nr:hypothetical protein [Planctomycetota bacterium]
MKYSVEVNGREIEVEIEASGEEILARVGGREHRIELRRVDGLGQFAALVDGRAFALSVDEEEEGKLRIGLAGEGYAVAVEDERERASRRAERGSQADGPRVVRGG